MNLLDGQQRRSCFQILLNEFNRLTLNNRAAELSGKNGVKRNETNNIYHLYIYDTGRHDRNFCYCPNSGGNRGGSQSARSAIHWETNPPEPERLPQEIIDFFAGGITVDEFLTLNKGQMPNAILAYMNLPVVVIVQLEEPSLVTHMSEQPGFPITKMKAEMQQSYVAKLTAFQDGVINQIHSKGIEATIMGRYTKALNGFMTRVPFNDLSKIRSIPGVKSVSRAPEHTVDLSHSVPLIHAVDVWYNTGYTGADITIASSIPH